MPLTGLALPTACHQQQNVGAVSSLDRNIRYIYSVPQALNLLVGNAHPTDSLHLLVGNAIDLELQAR